MYQGTGYGNGRSSWGHGGAGNRDAMGERLDYFVACGLDLALAESVEMICVIRLLWVTLWDYVDFDRIIVGPRIRFLSRLFIIATGLFGVASSFGIAALLRIVDILMIVHRIRYTGSGCDGGLL